MTEINPIAKGAAVESPKPAVTVPDEPRTPWGRQIPSVPPHPTPLVAAVPDEQARPDDNAKRLHIAQARADITGTGSLVDIIV